MADRRVRYILDVDYEGGTVALQAADDLRDVESAARSAGDGLDESTGAWSKAQAAWVSANAALGVLETGFGAVAGAARTAYETIASGAEIELQQQQFDALAASIGTTGSVLQNDLSAATMGLQSNAEMVAGATQLMSLGLAKNHEEVVALSEDSGQLNWDMQILGLTIANQSTARLDSLGLSIDAVKGKMAEFQALGMSTDEAFKWAIIEAGRDKIEITGSTAETAAGKLQILEAVVANVQDEFARGAASGFADALGEVAGNAQTAGSALSYASGVIGTYLGSELGKYITAVMQIGVGWEIMIAQGAEMQMQAQREAELTALRTTELQEMTTAYEKATAAQAYTTTQTAALAMATEDWGGVAEDAVEYNEWIARAAEWVAEAQARAAAADRDRAAAMAEMAAQAELAAVAQQLWTDYTEEATARGGDYFAQIADGGVAAFDLGEAIYNSADAMGAGMGILGDLGVQYGIFNDQTAAAIENAAQQQAIIDYLAGAAEQGRIPWDEYAIAVEKALALLEGIPAEATTPPARVPIELELTDTGDYEHITSDMFPQIEIQPAANMDEVNAAVEEARGMLEGFADTPWETTVTLNTEDVLDGVGRVQTALAEIPEYRHITLDFTATGLEFLDELRAAGVIP